MLRDELLRSKNDEIAYVINFAVFSTFFSIDCNAFHLATFILADGRINSRHCLLSRKHKLTELYFATVGFAGATDGGGGGGGGAPADSRYRQKEQAFLDANDLSKYALDLFIILCMANSSAEIASLMNLLFLPYPTMLSSYHVLRPRRLLPQHLLN